MKGDACLSERRCVTKLEGDGWLRCREMGC